MSELIPVFDCEIQEGNTVKGCNARNLHGFLGVGRKFIGWIKGRIKQYGFIEGEDYIYVHNLSYPDWGSSKSRQQQMVEYHITLDMAKELAMVENNETGRMVRRYFIQLEKRAQEILEIRANRELPLQQVRSKLKDTLHLKTLFALQKQAVQIARQLDTAAGKNERKVLYSVLCYICASMGIVSPELEDNFESGKFIKSLQTKLIN